MNATIEYAEKKISGQEYRRILKILGYKVMEFADHVERSKELLYKNVFPLRIVTIKWVDKLIEFVGEENFRGALAEARKTTDYLRQKYNIKPVQKA